MKKPQKFIQVIVALTLLVGIIAFAAYSPGVFENVAWNSGHAWVPNAVPANVAWNSRVAWTGSKNLPTPNVAWNSGIAWSDACGQLLTDGAWLSVDCADPGDFPQSVAWNS